MKKMILLCLTSIILFGCKKENELKSDFRSKYEGDFNFTITRTENMWNEGVIFDTTYSADGYIKITGPEKDSLVEIHYGLDTIGIVDNMGNIIVITESSAYKILKDTSLKFPVDMGSSLMMNGCFKGYDTIEMNIRYGGLGYWTNRFIKGYRKK